LNFTYVCDFFVFRGLVFGSLVFRSLVLWGFVFRGLVLWGFEFRSLVLWGFVFRGLVLWGFVFRSLVFRSLVLWGFVFRSLVFRSIIGIGSSNSKEGNEDEELKFKNEITIVYRNPSSCLYLINILAFIYLIFTSNE
jgi:hypothetical protein